MPWFHIITRTCRSTLTASSSWETSSMVPARFPRGGFFSLKDCRIFVRAWKPPRKQDENVISAYFGKIVIEQWTFNFWVTVSAFQLLRPRGFNTLFDRSHSYLIATIFVKLNLKQGQELLRLLWPTTTSGGWEVKWCCTRLNKWAEGSTSRGHSDCCELIQSNVQLDHFRF